MAKSNEVIPIASFQHSGTTTVIQVEETPRLRRIAILRTRMIFGELKVVGQLHIYPTEGEKYIEAIQRGEEIMKVVGVDGFEAASFLGDKSVAPVVKE